MTQNNTQYLYITEYDTIIIEGTNFVEANDNLQRLKETSKDLQRGSLYVKCAEDYIN